jgi:hypothetical protein
MRNSLLAEVGQTFLLMGLTALVVGASIGIGLLAVRVLG